MTPQKGATGNVGFGSALVFLTNMGHARPRPKRLAEKLLQIREALGLSQKEMAKLLSVERSACHILKSCLLMPRAVRVEMEEIVDDDRDLNL